MPKKFGPAGDYRPLKVSTLKVNAVVWGRIPTHVHLSSLS